MTFLVRKATSERFDQHSCDDPPYHSGLLRLYFANGTRSSVVCTNPPAYCQEPPHLFGSGGGSPVSMAPDM